MDARLEQFKWEDDTSPSYFSLYFIRFERYMRLRQILVEEAETDFVRRLKLAAQQANITDEKVILMQILCSTTSDKIRGKIMTEGTTLQLLLDWQESHDIVANEMNKDESSKINAITTKQHSNINTRPKIIAENVNKPNIITADNENDIAMRTSNLCFYCNLSYPHRNGVCPAANERCTYCNKLGHRVICCFSRMQLILSRANQLKPGNITKFKQNNPPYQNEASISNNNRLQHTQHTNFQKHTPNNHVQRVKHQQNKPTTEATKLPASTKKTIQAVAIEDSDCEQNYECTDNDCPCCASRNMFQITSQCKRLQRNRPHIEVTVNNTRISMLLDTGADLNVCSASTYERLVIRPRLTHSSTRFTPFGSDISQPTLGFFSTLIKLNGVQKRLKIFVVDDTHTKVENILCYQALLAFKLVTINVPTINAVKTDTLQEIREDFTKRMKKKFPKLWQNRIGLVPGVQIHLEVDDKITPSQQVPFDIAYSLIPGCEKKLNFLDKQQVTRSIPPGTHTGWISPIRVVPKDGVDKDGHQNVRVTINSIKLNQAVVKTKRVMPNTKQLLRQLNGKKFFTKLDIRDAFHTIALDEESQKYTVFATNTHGLKIQTRLWMGLCVSSELYHEVMSAKLRGLEDVAQAIDDIMVASCTLQECMVNTEKALARLDELNLTISDKCKFLQTEINFWGYEINQHGTKPMVKKLQALRESPTPTNAKETLSFICLAAYFMDRIPYLSTLCEPLREISYHQNLFNWTSLHDEAFDRIKDTIITKCLGHFDEKFETELWVDASPRGCGAFLMQIQNGKRVLIACASKTHSKAENNYSHVEKECKACVWACNKFKTYLLGKDFTLLTDNKSVALILEPSYDLKRQTTLRLQNWKSELVQYSRMVVRQIKGELNIADFLSRCIANNGCEKVTTTHVFDMSEHAYTKEDFNIAAIKHYLKALTLTEIAAATDQDECLKYVKDNLIANHTVLHKATDNQFNSKLNFLRLIYNELSLTNEGCILYEDRIVIPDDLRQRIIELTHEGHMGINSCKKLIRDNYFFRDIDKMVKEHVDYCLPCQANTDVSYLHPMQIRPPPPRKMYRLYIDFTSRSPLGDYQLVAVCAYSKYPFFMLTKRLTADAVIEVLKKLFKQVGVPHEIVSDNGPAFKSNDYNNFLKSLNVKRILITPEWPRGNGLAERMMKNINRVIRCSLVAKKPWKKALEIYLNNYRATPHSSTKFTPNQLMGFENKIKMPSYKRLTEVPELILTQNSEKATSIMKKHADKHHHAKQVTFQIDQKVLVKYDDSIKPRIKSNKFKSLYDPEHYIIKQIKNTMITAQRENHVITRNSSFFRNFNQKEEIKKISIAPIVNYMVYSNDQNWNPNALKDFLKNKREQKLINEAKSINHTSNNNNKQSNDLNILTNNKLKQLRDHQESRHKVLQQNSNEDNSLHENIKQIISIDNSSRYFDTNETLNESLNSKQPSNNKDNKTSTPTMKSKSSISLIHSKLPQGSGLSINENMDLARQTRLKNSKHIIREYTLLMKDLAETKPKPTGDPQVSQDEDEVNTSYASKQSILSNDSVSQQQTIENISSNESVIRTSNRTNKLIGKISKTATKKIKAAKAKLNQTQQQAVTQRVNTNQKKKVGRPKKDTTQKNELNLVDLENKGATKRSTRSKKPGNVK